MVNILGMGRPTKYTNDIAGYICDQLINGRSLRDICREDNMPDKSTVIRWLASNQEFATKCAGAREQQADYMDDKILDVAERCERGEIEPNAAKVSISAYQWRASKLKPKVYGDKQIVDVNIDMSISDRLERASKIIEGRVAALPVIECSEE